MSTAALGPAQLAGAPPLGGDVVPLVTAAAPALVFASSVAIIAICGASEVLCVACFDWNEFVLCWRGLEVPQ